MAKKKKMMWSAEGKRGKDNSVRLGECCIFGITKKGVEKAERRKGCKQPV